MDVIKWCFVFFDNYVDRILNLFSDPCNNKIDLVWILDIFYIFMIINLYYGMNKLIM
jgi:hypothetical protein